jgi:hypothetical protein
MFTKMLGFASFLGAIRFGMINNQLVAKNKPWQGALA